MRALGLGILGTAKIAAKNWKAIHASGTATVRAVASRDVARSRQFVDACQAESPFQVTPAAVGTYEELLALPDVDAVYVPLPTAIRKEWVLRAAAAGKHVLCEKPCGVSAADVADMIARCRAAGVQFMDGVMFAHNPRLARVRDVLDDNRSVGDVRRITSAFSFNMSADTYDSNVRVDSRLEPAGCAGDLGWYCIRFALWAMRWQLPRQVTGRLLSEGGSSRSPASVPLEFTGELLFDAGVSAGFYCSFLSQFQNWTHVSGPKGWLRIPDFVQPADNHEIGFEVNGADVRIPYCDCGTTHRAQAGAMQAVYMIRHFSDQIRSGVLNDEWPMSALRTQQVLDACLESARNGSRPIDPKAGR